MTSTAAEPCLSARRKNARAAAPLADQDIDHLTELIHRAVQVVQRPATFTYVSSTYHLLPGRVTRRRAASMNSEVKVCTHR